MCEMSELINFVKQYFNSIEVETVSARELHQLLESKSDFSTWIKKRIDKYQFEENLDYIRLHQKVEANNATKIDYF